MTAGMSRQRVLSLIQFAVVPWYQALSEISSATSTSFSEQSVT
jgi:hypothetical protein